MGGSGSGLPHSAHLPGKPCVTMLTLSVSPLSYFVSYNKQRPTMFHSDHTYEDGEVEY